MDLSKLSRGQLIAGVGGVLLVLSLFLGWVSVFGGTQTAFDAFSGMDIIMLVIGAAAVAFAVVTAAEASVDLPANTAVILSVLGVLVVGWALGWVLEEPSAGFGAWLGLIGAGAIVYGGWEAHRSPAPMAASRPAAQNAPGPGTTGSAPGTTGSAPGAPGATGSAPGRPGSAPRATGSAPRATRSAPGATGSASQATASVAKATEAAAEAAAAAADEAGAQTRRHDRTTVEQPAAAPPKPRVAPGGEADTITPRPSGPTPTSGEDARERPDAGSAEPDGA
ncbi:MAG TPA: hypothetical protein VGI87_16520 [Solirubrobacteraceae bacterium]